VRLLTAAVPNSVNPFVPTKSVAASNRAPLGSGKGLARTGSGIMSMMVLALIAMALGGLLVRISARRTSLL